MTYTENKAKELAFEKHFFDKAQPFYPMGFEVFNRNPGHWDVIARQCPGKISAWKAAHPDGNTIGRDGDEERAFTIRGEPGDVIVHDERWNPHKPHPREPMQFRNITTAMLWICGELMVEPE